MTLAEIDRVGVAGIGHNNPPEATLEEQLHGAAADLIAERDSQRYVEAMTIWQSRTELADDDQEETATNFIAKVRGLTGRFETMRETEKDPFLSGGRTVDAFFREAKSPLERAEAHVRKLLDAYKAKKLSVARAEQARLAEEARKAAATAKTVEDMGKAAQLATAAAAPVEPVRAHTAGGAMSSMRTEWHAEIVDIDQVPREFLSYDERKVRAYLAGLPKGAAPSKPGLKFTETVKSIVRGK